MFTRVVVLCLSCGLCLGLNNVQQQTSFGVQPRTSLSTGDGQARTNFAGIIDILFNIGKNYYFDGNGLPNRERRFQCPLCDSSVFSYCSEKLLHDACCCLDPYEHDLPRQCRYADCSFLHAHSCEEHKLITACCCSRI